MPAQIYVGVALGDTATHVSGDFGAVSKFTVGGSVAMKVEQFKACIIAARRWTNVDGIDFTIQGPWATDSEARSSFAPPSAKLVSATDDVATIELAGAAYVVARVASGVTPLRGASGLHRVLPPRVHPCVARLRRRVQRSLQHACSGGPLAAAHTRSSLVARVASPLLRSTDSRASRSG